MTYSIVARDEATGQLGAACESHFFAPGGPVLWARPGIGAIATQAFIDGRYGGTGMSMLAAGASAPEILAKLRAEDPHPQVRQVGMVGTTGEAASWTGESCIAACGGIVDGSAAVIGNMLDNDDVLPAMLAAYRNAGGDLAQRIMTAMEAGEAAGGDIRGSQGAAIIIVNGEQVPDPWNHVPVDLRVEDHHDPIGELGRLLRYRRAFDAVAGTMFAPGLMVGAYREPNPGDTDRALAELAAAAEVMVGNPEAHFWRGILLARSGDLTAGRDQLAVALAAKPRLTVFLDRLADAGFLDPNDVVKLK